MRERRAGEEASVRQDNLLDVGKCLVPNDVCLVISPVGCPGSFAVGTERGRAGVVITPIVPLQLALRGGTQG